MTEEKKLPAMAVGQNTGLMIRDIEEVQRAANLFIKSGMFAEKNGEQDLARACVKIIAGQEFGLKPFAAMRGIDIIQGTPTFRYQLVGARIKQSRRYDFAPVESTDKVAKIQFYDRGKPTFLSVFTIEDAVKQGLAHKDGYKKMPADMLYARALTKGANKVCPELFYGDTYAPEDFGESSGEAVVDTENGVAEEVTVEPTAAATEPPVPKKFPRGKASIPSSADTTVTPAAETSVAAAEDADAVSATNSQERALVEQAAATEPPKKALKLF